jgi:seryl-tRNA synthetase
MRAPSAEEKQLQQQLQQLEQQIVAGVQKIGQKLEELNAAQQNQQLELRQLAVRLAMLATRTVMRQLNQETEQRHRAVGERGAESNAWRRGSYGPFEPEPMRQVGLSLRRACEPDANCGSSQILQFPRVR